MPRILLIGVLTFFFLFDKLPAQTPITIKNNHFYVDVVLGKLRGNMDFTRSKTSWGYLNATIFMGKTIVLDFKKQIIGIIE